MLSREKYPQKQAVAIALSTARKVRAYGGRMAFKDGSNVTPDWAKEDYDPTTMKARFKYLRPNQNRPEPEAPSSKQPKAAPAPAPSSDSDDILNTIRGSYTGDPAQKAALPKGGTRADDSLLEIMKRQYAMDDRGVGPGRDNRYPSFRYPVYDTENEGTAFRKAPTFRQFSPRPENEMMPESGFEYPQTPQAPAFASGLPQENMPARPQILQGGPDYEGPRGVTGPAPWSKVAQTERAGQAVAAAGLGGRVGDALVAGRPAVHVLRARHAQVRDLGQAQDVAGLVVPGLALGHDARRGVRRGVADGGLGKRDLVDARVPALAAVGDVDVLLAVRVHERLVDLAVAVVVLVVARLRLRNRADAVPAVLALADPLALAGTDARHIVGAG